MTAKEKAMELYDRFYFMVPSYTFRKECASIMVDEILSLHLLDEGGMTFSSVSDKRYWQEVKSEIEKI